jgi:hypothetical protein
MSFIEQLCFPSSRSVGNCRKDAKRLSKREGIPLHAALDRVAKGNGINLPWASALAVLQGKPENHHIAAGSSDSFMTIDDIRVVMEKHAELTHHGLGVYLHGISSSSELEVEYRRQRASLAEAVGECNNACRFLQHVGTRKTINRGYGSYGLKHRAERYLRELADVRNPYVANGAFICAAVHMGFEFKPIGEGNPNVRINCSSRSSVFLWEKLSDERYLPPRQQEALVRVKGQIGL